MVKNQRSGRRPQHGRDLRYDLTLKFEQAYFGDAVDIQVHIPIPCPKCEGSGADVGYDLEACLICNGSGQVRDVMDTTQASVNCPHCGGRGQVIAMPCSMCEGTGRVGDIRTQRLEVPPGVDSGTQIRLHGQGESGAYGGIDGNLYVVISVEPHQRFERHLNDIVLNIDISETQAVLGDSIVVQTVEGKATIKIKPGTKTGTVIKLRKKGFPKLRANGTIAGRGNQLCIVNIS